MRVAPIHLSFVALVSAFAVACGGELASTRANPTLTVDKVPSPMAVSQPLQCNFATDLPDDAADTAALLRARGASDAPFIAQAACNAVREAIVDESRWKVDPTPFRDALRATASNSLLVPVATFSDRCSVSEVGVRTCRGTKTELALLLLAADGTVLWRGKGTAEQDRSKPLVDRLFAAVPR